MGNASNHMIKNKSPGIMLHSCSDCNNINIKCANEKSIEKNEDGCVIVMRSEEIYFSSLQNFL